MEDNATNAEILMHFASGWEAHAVCVDSTAAARAALARAADAGAPYQIAIVDWKLPGESGLALGRPGLLAPPRRPIPLVLLTSMTASNVVQAARESGFAAHLTKPVRRSELYRTMSRLLASEAAGR